MVEFVTGVSGSGKTYRAMLSLYTNFGIDKTKIKDKSLIHNDVDFALTNINEIKFDKFEKEKVLFLDWDKFYNSLKQLHTMYKSKATDSQLQPISKELGLFRVLVIVDECHNYLDNQDAVLVWWLSYHRHFHQQIYLITQNLGLVNSKYKAFSEFFYKARPSSLKLFNHNMIYFQFIDSRMSQKSKSNTIKLSIVKDVFDSYGSGANQKSTNVIKRFLLIALVLFVFLLILFSLFIKHWSNSDDVKVTDKATNHLKTYDHNNFNRNNQISNYYQNKSIYKIYCTSKICLINNISFSLKYIDFLKNHFDFKLIQSSFLKNFSFNEYRLFISESDFNKLFTSRSVSNETDIKSSNNFIPDFFKSN